MFGVGRLQRALVCGAHLNVGNIKANDGQMLKADLRHRARDGGIGGASAQRHGGQQQEMSTIYHSDMMQPECDGIKTLVCKKVFRQFTRRQKRTVRPGLRA